MISQRQCDEECLQESLADLEEVLAEIHHKNGMLDQVERDHLAAQVEHAATGVVTSLADEDVA